MSFLFYIVLKFNSPLHSFLFFYEKKLLWNSTFEYFFKNRFNFIWIILYLFYKTISILKRIFHLLPELSHWSAEDSIRNRPSRSLQKSAPDSVGVKMTSRTTRISAMRWSTIFKVQFRNAWRNGGHVMHGNNY